MTPDPHPTPAEQAEELEVAAKIAHENDLRKSLPITPTTCECRYYRTRKMKLIDDARKVLRRAWSVRLGIIAAIFSGAEVIVPLFVDAMPRALFAVLSFLTVVAAVLARFVAQPKMHDE